MEGARIALSCASCRQRKLKCDRSQPCGNCTTRNVDCVYASMSRGRGVPPRRDGGNSQLDARIRRLEQLVTSMAQQMPQNSNSGSVIGPQTSEGSDGLSDGFASLDSVQTDLHQIKPGQMTSNSAEVTYVSSTHWAAVCNELADMREHFDQITLAEQELDSPDHAHRRVPMLLEGPPAPSDMNEILADIPPRNISDILVSRYFNTQELAMVILHAPTFEKQATHITKYNEFWLNPQKTSTAWVGMLLGVLGVGAFLIIRSGDALPEDFGPPMEVMETLHRRSTECLVLSNYSTTPGPFTMEALHLNIQNEFVRRRDASVGVWVLCGVGIRVAFRMGYHRDPSHYPQVSAFEGEMRRRVWAVILQVDALTSCQIGLPPLIQESQCDTQLPTNLYDEEFGPNSVHLPPPRPETELTPVLYTIAKSRLSSVFREVFNQVSLGRMESYNQIMELDQRLHNTFRSTSARFQMTSLAESVTVPAYLLIRRFSLVLLYEKARCLLHRYHMTKSYQNPEYNYSRSSCVEAAMAILKHQTDISREVMPGGLLYKHRWFVASIELHDFLLGSMVICLELNSRSTGQAASENDSGQGILKFGRKDLAQALRGSQNYLDLLSTTSSEARKAAKILSIMLSRFSEQAKPQPKEQTPSTKGIANGNHTASNYVLPSHSRDATLPSDSSTFDTSGWQAEPPNETPGTFSSTLDGINSFFNAPDIVDWDQWEAYIQISRTAEEPQ